MSQDLLSQDLDAFFCGLQSMTPMGVSLPWTEVVRISARFGWTPKKLLQAADCWQMLDSLQIDPPNATEQSPPSRVRLLRRPDWFGAETGCIDVSSDEGSMSGSAAEVARPLSRRWRAGALTPAPGSEMEIFLPEGLNLQLI